MSGEKLSGQQQAAVDDYLAAAKAYMAGPYLDGQSTRRTFVIATCRVRDAGLDPELITEDGYNAKESM